jgi:hypothetical protein
MVAGLMQSIQGPDATTPAYLLCAITPPAEPKETMTIELVNAVYVWFHSATSSDIMIGMIDTASLELDYAGGDPSAQACRFTKDEKWVKLPPSTS